MAPHRVLPLLQASGAIALWAALALLGVKLKHLPPFLLVGVALLIGAVPGLLFMRRWTIRVDVLCLGIAGIFGFHFLLFMALRTAPPVEANLINYLWPLFIVILAPAVLPGETLTARHVLAACVGFAGAGLLATRGDFGFDTRYAAGYALALASALTWALYSLLSRRVKPFSTETVSLFCLASGAGSLACHAAFEPAITLRGTDWPLLIVLGLGPMGAAFYLWDRAMKHGDPKTIGTLAYATPLASTLLLVAGGVGELNAVSLVAMAMIVGAALFAIRGDRARTQSV